MHFGKLRCRPMQNESKKSWGRGVIDRYRSHLPVSETTPIVTLGEGSTPLVLAPRLSDRIAGQKTAAFETIDELGDAPDIHILPLGNAGNLTAYAAGYSEYKQLGKSGGLPRMIGIQAEHAAPIFHRCVIEKPETIASAIRIGNPASWELAQRAIDDSGGAVETVTDREKIGRA